MNSPEVFPSAQLVTLRQEVKSMSGDQLVKQVLDVAERAADMKQKTDKSIKIQGSAPDEYGGDPKDKDSAKAKIIDVKTAVQRILIAAEQKKTVPLQFESGQAAISGAGATAQTILRKLSEAVPVEKITEQSSPYIYQLIHRVLTGNVTSVDELTAEFGKIHLLHDASPALYEYVQKGLMSAAREIASSIDEMDLRKRFGLEKDDEEEDEKEKQDKINVSSNKNKEGYDREKQIENTKRLGDLLLRIRGNKDIKPAKAEELIENIIKTNEVSSQDVAAELSEIGFQQGEIDDAIRLGNEYKVLHQSIREGRTDYLEGGLGRNYLTDETKMLYTVDGLKHLLEEVDPDHPGKKRISATGRRLLKRRSLEILNKLMENVDNNPDTDFHQNFSDLREGMAYFQLQTMINGFMKEVEGSSELINSMGEQGVREVAHFIKTGVLQELAREKTMRELFHTLGIYIKTMGPDKIAEYMARYNLSDIDSLMTSDVSGKIISLAMSEYERYLKFDIMKNKGTVRTSLFAGKSNLNLMYHDNEDRTNLRERLRTTLVGLKKYINGGDDVFSDSMKKQIGENSDIQRWDINNIEEFEDWELDRALKYAQGIHLTQTIRGFEIIASTRPNEHYRGGADNFIDMAAALNPSWKWQLGRGGPQKMPRYREALTADMIVKNPEKNLWKRIANDLFGKGRWDPKQMHETYGRHVWRTDEIAAEKWSEIKDKWLYKDMNFQKMIKLFGLGGMADRAGWRLTGFQNGIDYEGSEFDRYVSSIQQAVVAASNEKGGEKTVFGLNQETYDQLAKSVGVGSRFFFDTARGTAFAKEELWKYLEKSNSKLSKGNLSDREQNKLWYEYTYGKHGNEELYELPDGEKITFQELAEIKTLMFRGMNFEALNERAPLDFLNSMVNITPELLTEGLEPEHLKDKRGGVNDVYFIFNENELRAKVQEIEGTPGKQKELLLKIKAKQADWRRMWGEDNFEHLTFIRNFYKGVEGWGEKYIDKNKLSLKGGYKKEKIWEVLYRTMDLATERVKLRNSPTLTRDDIVVLEEGGTNVDEELTDELRDLFCKENTGLISYFKNLNEDFGGDQTIGKKGFFYHAGRAWFNELGHKFPPDTSDVDWRFILHNMGANSGENTIKRLWGDLDMWNKAVTKIMGLDDILANCAKSHSMEEMLKLHGEIRNLKGIAGDELVYEMQYYLAQVSARYFQENSNSRMPFLLGQVYNLFNGKELSLSKIYGGRGVMSLTTDGINKYFQELKYNDFIAEEGIYGFERLSQALGADWQKLITAEIIPNVSTALAMFILWRYLKDALDESGGKKKK